MAVGPILSWVLQFNKHREDWNEMVPNFIPELYARVSNKTRLIFYHWLHYHYYSRILLQSFLFIDACHWARYAFPSYFVVALTPPPCAHRSDTTECTPMPEQCWPSPELGPTDPSTPAQHREAVIAKRCFLPCLWWLDLGQHVFDLWGSVSVAVGRGMKLKSIFCYVHILSVSDVDEFKYGAEPERSVDQRARLRGWPMCDTCL